MSSVFVLFNKYRFFSSYLPAASARKNSVCSKNDAFVRLRVLQPPQPPWLVRLC